MRITTVRIIVQAVIFALFLAFVLLTTFANLDQFPGLRLWVGKLLQIDPLVAIATAVTTHAVYRGLLWSLVILIPTLFLGRFFCNWICPYGTLHQFVRWLFRRGNPKETIEDNRYRRSQHIKYYILVAMLAAAFFGSLQIGLLDPICLLYRSFTGAVLPAAGMPTDGFLGPARFHQGAWLIGFLLFGLVAANLVIPRFFCRVLCPLGALLGWLSRFAWWRIERDLVKCSACNSCQSRCEGACDPHSVLRKSECFVCFNCVDDCPEGALRFALLPPREHEVTGSDVPGRRMILAATAGVLFFPFVRTSGKTTRRFSSQVIRPPGAVEELEFLERCIKCDQCVRVCPTNVLQPAWFEAGLEGLWSPVLDFRVGHCQLNCTACGHVCPTGAIRPISPEEKLGLGTFSDSGPIRLGTAHFDTGRCLPYSSDVSCAVCEEVCPTSPKAVHTVTQMRVVRGGRLQVRKATDHAIVVQKRPEAGAGSDSALPFRANQWRSDGTKRYVASIRHADGVVETHAIVDNGEDTLTIDGWFTRLLTPGDAVTLLLELEVPRIDPVLCIGCGICERECPVVGDRRAVYVTAEGETRSEHHTERDRNRSVRLSEPRRAS